MAYETIIYEKESGVATITLNRPQALNAFVPQMNQEVMDALKSGERDQDVRCFLITGAGRAFCAGQDLKGRTPDQKGSLGASLREKYNPMIRQIRQMEKIVIAAVNGVAAGAGKSHKPVVLLNRNRAFEVMRGMSQDVLSHSVKQYDRMAVFTDNIEDLWNRVAWALGHPAD